MYIHNQPTTVDEFTNRLIVRSAKAKFKIRIHAGFFLKSLLINIEDIISTFPSKKII